MLPWQRESAAPFKSSSGCATSGTGAGRGSVSLAQGRAVAPFLLELHSLTSASVPPPKRLLFPASTWKPSRPSSPPRARVPGAPVLICSTRICEAFGEVAEAEKGAVPSRAGWCWFSSALGAAGIVVLLLPHIPPAVGSASSAGPPWQPWALAIGKGRALYSAFQPSVRGLPASQPCHCQPKPIPWLWGVAAIQPLLPQPSVDQVCCRKLLGNSDLAERLFPLFFFFLNFLNVVALAE